MNTSLRTNLHTKLSACASKVYFDEAPKNVPGDYIVFKCMDGNNDYDSESKYPKDMIQVVGHEKDLTALEVIEAAVELALDQQQSTFSVDDYRVVECVQKFRTQGKISDTYFFVHHYFIDRELN